MQHPIKKGRPLTGRTVRRSTSVRVEEELLKKIKKKHGSLQKWIDLKITEMIGHVKTKKEEIQKCQKK